METYIRYRNIEESTVQLMAQEISKVEGIEITKSGYDELVNSLRAIKDRTEINMTDLEFAKSLIEMPVVERLFWLEEKIHEHVIQSDSVNESIELNNLLEGLIM